MPYTITDNCISCNRCETVCPTNAIKVEGLNKWIDANLCNNCDGYYSVPQCAASCPTNRGCVPSLSNYIPVQANGDYWDTWFNLHDCLIERLYRTKQTRYWNQWFKAYSEKLQEQIQSSSLQTAGSQA